MSGSSVIALVTVLFNCEKHLPLFFRSLGSQTDQDFLLIVIDNASSDRSLATARELVSETPIQSVFVANESNCGIAAANNQGIEYARSLGLEHVVLLNNDISCDSALINHIRERAIGGGHRVWTCLAYRGDTSERWYGGGYLSFWRARGVHFGESESQRIRAPVTVTYAPACLMYLHTSVLDATGPMDPEYFVYYDDTDFCRRVQDAKIDIVYDPGVSFRHYVGGSSGGELSQFFLRISTRNKFLYISKHYKGSSKYAVATIALASKAIQLLTPRRRHATWAGMMDALRLFRGKRARA